MVRMGDPARRHGFADETKTGRFLAEARGIRRALVAAQVDGRDYEWWLRLKRDFLTGMVEPKSPEVLSLIAQNRRARETLLQGLDDARATIIVVDFSEYAASIVRDLYELARMPLTEDPLEIIAERRLGPQLTEAILRAARDEAIAASIVARIEWLFQEALWEAPVLLPQEPGELVNRQALRAMDANQQRELIGRFSVVFGEALDPRHLADILSRRLEDMRYFAAGHLAYRQLAQTLAADRTFDKGSERVFSMVAEAHDKMAEALDHAWYGRLDQTLRAGALSQEDSRHALGIRIADIAAGVAAREYELAPGGVRQKAERVRAIFRRAMLNDEWL
jgi:hypothetical protein